MHRQLNSWFIVVAAAAVLICAGLAWQHLVGGMAGPGQAQTTLASSQKTPSGASSRAIAQTRVINGNTIAFTATSDQFGSYTVTVTVRDTRGVPLQGATVEMVLTMPEMQMAALRVTLPPISPPAPGVYQGQAVLAGGLWQAVVQVLAADVAQPLRVTFRFSIK